MNILGFLIASVVMTVMPGPDIVFVFTQGLTFGRRSGIAVALGLCSGLIVHTTAVALGLVVVITKSAALFNGIQYLGVLYLIYMGIMAWRARNKVTQQQQSGYVLTTAQLYKRGVMMNLLNPKIIIFFLAFLPQFVNVESATPKTDIFILGGIFALQAITIFSVVSVLAGWISKRLSIDKISGKKIATINAFVYWAIALFFILAIL